MPPPGTIGIVSGELGRFTEFAVSMLRLIKPPDTRVTWIMSTDVTANFNRIVDHLEGDWLWIMGDDHLFDDDLLVRLLAHDLDVVVPNCQSRQAPFKPVVYSGISGTDENGFDVYDVAKLPGAGVHEVFACGSAGMLIRRHVLDAIDRPVFETSGRHQNEDLNLCQKIREAGFAIHCDVKAYLGHIGVVNVFPLFVQQEQRWATVIQSGDEFIPIIPADMDVRP